MTSSTLFQQSVFTYWNTIEHNHEKDIITTEMEILVKKQRIIIEVFGGLCPLLNDVLNEWNGLLTSRVQRGLTSVGRTKFRV